MRQILFRAWDRQENRMIDSEEITYGQYHDTTYFHPNARERYELMQWTGLEDKNGVKIFEGDVVRYSSTDTEGEVRFWQGRFLISSDKHNAHYDLYITSDLEVIGSIHTHPELLKEGE